MQNERGFSRRFGAEHLDDSATRNASDPERPYSLWALFTGPYKVIVRQEWDKGRQHAGVTRGEVYDLDRDPGETENLATSDDPRVRHAVRRYTDVLTRLYQLAGEFSAGTMPASDADELATRQERLAELGYIAPRDVSEQPPPSPFPDRDG